MCIVHLSLSYVCSYRPLTMHPRNRQDDFWITVSFSIVLFSFKVQESISDHLKIFHLALFEKKFQNLITPYFAYRIYWVSRKYCFIVDLNS